MDCCHCFDKYKQDDVDEIAVGSDLLQALSLFISCSLLLVVVVVVAAHAIAAVVVLTEIDVV